VTAFLKVDDCGTVRSSDNSFTFQEDSEFMTVEFLHPHKPHFIKAANLLPNSQYLNPMDYSIWGTVQ